MRHPKVCASRLSSARVACSMLAGCFSRFVHSAGVLRCSYVSMRMVMLSSSVGIGSVVAVAFMQRGSGSGAGMSLYSGTMKNCL